MHFRRKYCKGRKLHCHNRKHSLSIMADLFHLFNKHPEYESREMKKNQLKIVKLGTKEVLHNVSLQLLPL